MKQQNIEQNLIKLRPYFCDNDLLMLDNYIPEYFYDQLCLPTSELDFDKAVKNVDIKLKRDWLYHTSFMTIVDVVSKLGTCSRRQVGAVLVRDRRILATGFNGTPPGAPHCNDEICPGRKATSGSDLSLCAAVHAEENCLLYCAKYGTSASGSSLYCSCEPCDDCMKLVETVGIKTVIYGQPYPTKMSALRQYFKAKCYSLDDLSKLYSSFIKNRAEFPVNPKQ